MYVNGFPDNKGERGQEWYKGIIKASRDWDSNALLDILYTAILVVNLKKSFQQKTIYRGCLALGSIPELLSNPNADFLC